MPRKRNPPTEDQKAFFETHGLILPPKRITALWLIYWFENALRGTQDNTHFLQRIADFRALQEKWIGKHVRMTSGGKKRGIVLFIFCSDAPGLFKIMVRWDKGPPARHNITSLTIVEPQE